MVPLLSMPLEIDPATLVPPVGVRTMSTQFGFLLRHYWTPATELSYRIVECRAPAGSEPSESVRAEKRTMVRCDADLCIWRTEDELHAYDRSAQTFRTKSVLATEWSPANDDAARLEAFLNIPVLTPLLPIPVGFRWHVAAEAGYLDFKLESVEKIGDATILFVRRHGEFRIEHDSPGADDLSRSANVTLDGRTAYSLERSLVLEDRVARTFRSEDPALDGMKHRRHEKLLESRYDPVSKPAPLFHRYRSERGNNYIYDCSTGHIVHTGNTVYRIVEDWRILTEDEIVRKYADLGPAAVETALEELNVLARKGLFEDHAPREMSRVDRIEYDGWQLDAGDFWKNGCETLILGVTERCNLCCEYCCYGGKFEGHRTHGQRSMDWATAKAAIREFLECDQVGALSPISFYGGEPLLELELMRRCVRYAEELAHFLDKKVVFAVTTNGTLLDDAAVDFLVEHDFLIMVSLDGPRESHDRYRLFGNGSGSFERIETNIRRFAGRHADYRKRGFNMTLAPPFDLDGTARFLDEYLPQYPLTRANLVNTGLETRVREWGHAPTRYGCFTQASCHSGCNDLDELDPFRCFGKTDRENLKRLLDRTVENMKTVGDAATWQSEPLGMMLFETQLAGCHRRGVGKPPEWVFFIPCLPGFTRRYVDIEGNYRVCERVDYSDAYVLGNVRDGPDPEKFQNAMELRRHFGDCGNCPSIKFCDACFARIPDSDAVETGFDPLFDRQCQQVRKTALRFLKTYTDIMESNRNAFERKTEIDLTVRKRILFGTCDTGPDTETLNRLTREIFEQ